MPEQLLLFLLANIICMYDSVLCYHPDLLDLRHITPLHTYLRTYKLGRYSTLQPRQS